jgi:hypothetical protein
MVVGKPNCQLIALPALANWQNFRLWHLADIDLNAAHVRS